jgi:predicted Zn finger-like uncharacterized protein
MLIICPDCESSYEVEQADLGADGRKVRCTECGAVWHASGEAATAAAEEIEPVVPAFGNQPFADEADEEAEIETLREPDLIDPSVEDVAFQDPPRKKSPLRRKPRGTAPRGARKHGVMPFVAAAGIAGLIALGIWRDTVVHLVPDLAGLYAVAGLPVNLRGLEFRDVNTAETMENGVPLLVVRGTIENVTKEAVDVPRLRLAVRGTSGREIFVWTAMPSKNELSAGEALPFFAQLASPPAEGREVAVRFIGARDAAQNMASK